MDLFRYLGAALPALLLFLFGYLVRYRRMHGLIAGFNTMPAAKQANVDAEELGRFVGGMLFLLGAILGVAMTLLLVLEQVVAGLVVLALLLPAIVVLLVRAQRFDGNAREADGRLKKSATFGVVGVVAFLVLVAGFVAFLLIQSSKPTGIAFQDGTLRISGLYGQDVPLADIRRVELLADLPAVEARTNGSALGDSLSGHFRLAGVGAAVLYLDLSRTPFLLVETVDQKIYLNLATPAETQALYASLQAALQAEPGS